VNGIGAFPLVDAAFARNANRLVQEDESMGIQFQTPDEIYAQLDAPEDDLSRLRKKVRQKLSEAGKRLRAGGVLSLEAIAKDPDGESVLPAHEYEPAAIAQVVADLTADKWNAWTSRTQLYVSSAHTQESWG